MEYLTPEDFEIAEANGINRQRAFDRFYKDGWSKKRAITQPMARKRPEFKQYKEICAANGINFTTFHARMNSGWTAEEASTKPIGYKLPRKLKITPEQFATAEANGISKGALWNRVSGLRWPIEKAITVPINAKYRKKTS